MIHSRKYLLKVLRKSKVLFGLLILILSCCQFQEGVAQNQALTDSLLQELNANQNDEIVEFQLLRRISHVHPDIQKALDYSTQAYEIAKAIDRLDLEAIAWEEIGLNQRLLGNKTKALRASYQALSIYEKLKDKEAQAAILGQLGTNAVVDGDFPLAIKVLNQALATYRNVYTSNGHNNHALTQLNLGEAYRLSGQLDSAKYWFENSLMLRDSIYEIYRLEILTAYATGNLGMVYNSMDQLDTARKYLSESITLTRELGDPYSTSVYLADLGVVEQKEGNYSQAEAYLLEAYEMATEEGLKEQIRDISELLVKFYEAQQDYGPALAYQKVYQQYQDSLVNKENVQEIEQLKANYEINKRESEIDLLTTINIQQRSLSIGLGVGLLLVFGLALVIYRTNGRLKHSNQELVVQKDMVAKREEEKGWLLHELNHRVKNNMQMIASLLNLQEGRLKGHPAEAAIAEGKYRVQALSLIHRRLYKSDRHTDIQLDEYLEELVRNLIHGYGFNWLPTLEVDRIKLHIDQAVPLALIVNELVTNSLKYAYKSIEAPQLLVKAEASKDEMKLVIQDNGIGMTTTLEEKETGFGSLLVKQLVSQLKGNLTQLPTEVGTAWELRFPA